MGLDLFRDAHVNRLRAAVGENLRRYAAAKPWGHRPLVRGECPTFPSGLEPAVPLAFVSPSSARNLHDFENAVVMHRAFPALTRAQAGDPRLWTRLAHVEGWEYMRRRWDVRPHRDDPGKATRYVLEHYFVAGPRPSRALTRNGMARLWWYAALTHDPARPDPYELTHELLSSLDTAQQLLERNLGRAPHVLRGFLQYLLDHPDELGEGRPRRNHIRHLAERLNPRGGLTLLDTLEPDGVAEMLTSEGRRYRPTPV